jgi:hypothetical protein
MHLEEISVWAIFFLILVVGFISYVYTVLKTPLSAEEKDRANAKFQVALAKHGMTWLSVALPTMQRSYQSRNF